MRGRRRYPAAATTRLSQRGVTFVESVLGVVLLGLVTASLAGAVAFMRTNQARLEQRLGAAELANRLILQYIDDDESLPNRTLPIGYGDRLYRWSMEQQRVRFKTRTSGAENANQGIGGGVSLDRVQLVTVRVWLSEESGGTRDFHPETANAVITRLIDPLAFSNPDSLETLLESPGGMERLMNRLMQLEEGTGGATQ